MQNEIEQMAKNVCHLDRTCDECMTSFECKAMMYAKRFYNAGYRKASDMMREVIDVLCELHDHFKSVGDIREAFAMLFVIAELKKKYTEGRE